MWFNGSDRISNDVLDFPVLDGKEASDWDSFSINQKNIKSELLMGWAGYAVFTEIARQKWFYESNRIHILAGSGNNGGDGYVLAWQILSSTKKKIIIWQLADPITDEAKYFCGLCNQKELEDQILYCRIADFNETSIHDCDIVIDAVFGTGLNKPPSLELQRIFNIINVLKNVIRIAMDISSGVYSNGDIFQHSVFKADYTYSFGSYKIGHMVEPGILHRGEIKVLPIGFFPQKFKNRRIIKSVNTPPLRKPGGHKYESGTLSVIGGSSGMEGAAIMAAKSFLSLGGGLARIYSLSNSIIKALQENPEFMIQTFPETLLLEKTALKAILLKPKMHVVVLGVGLQESLSVDFWKTIFSAEEISVVVDGSGLRQVALCEEYARKNTLNNLILTPHKSEAETLLGRKLTNVQKDALEISARYNAHVYLKGPGGILILNHPEGAQEIYLNSGHYELSTGGTGDVLSGVIGNFLLRFAGEEGIEPALSTYFKAANLVVQKYLNHRDFLTPSEIIENLRSAANES